MPDPDCEDYTGVRWSIVPVSVWQALLPRVRASGGHLYQLLDRAWRDGAYCVEAPLPDYVYLDTPLRVAVAGFITLSAADACRARAWLADSFLVDDLPEVLAGYQENLLWWIENWRESPMDPQAREGHRA